MQLACVLQVGEGLVRLTDHERVAVDENQGLLSQVLPVHAAVACSGVCGGSIQ